MPASRAPGVYREEISLPRAAELRTGVPAFIGFTTAAPDNQFAVPHRLTVWSQFETHFDRLPAAGYLAYAVRGFFDNQGPLCYVLPLCREGTVIEALRQGLEALVNNQDALAAFDKVVIEALRQGLEALEAVDMIDLVCAPDIMQAPEAARAMQAMVLEHCQNLGDRLAILDALPDPDRGKVLQQRQGLVGTNGAFYYPWVKVPGACPACRGTGTVVVPFPLLYVVLTPSLICTQCQGSGAGYVPPCGHVAGVYARSDQRVGVHKAPANEVLEGVLDLGVQDGKGAWQPATLTDTQHGELNHQGINCLRAFPGRGIRVWGARTLSHDPAWAYVNVRRLFLTAGRWVERHLADIAFEPHDARLWARIERELTVYFTDLLQRGALHGRTAQEAFYIKCDAETNPPEVRDRGEVISEIGLAAAAPNEFVVVRLTHGSSGVSITGPTTST
jgi:Bacteriophage tail sheath protein